MQVLWCLCVCICANMQRKIDVDLLLSCDLMMAGNEWKPFGAMKGDLTRMFDTFDSQIASITFGFDEIAV